jgi:hypothetical protein
MGYRRENLWLMNTPELLLLAVTMNSSEGRKMLGGRTAGTS